MSIYKPKSKITFAQVNYIIDRAKDLRWSKKHTMEEARRVTNTKEINLEDMNREDGVALSNHIIKLIWPIKK